MGNRRHRLRLLVLVLPVLLGVVGMHALVAPVPASAIETGHGTAAVTTERANHAAETPPTPAALPTVAAHQHETPPGHEKHDTAHGLHLCLAVLAAAGLALLAAWLFLGRLALPASVSPSRRRAHDRPVQRPPPVPRRLAQLCVMRT
ncbi:DUF6153 family protein [Pseudonocardia sp. NPDC049635]|uniref:DUF6153 family protein n=1 Tax=Pseudonocardia sp. NPDC049635 TaxID=3155506 RepID=UPI00340AEB53